jgi:hypothetical protein
MGNATNGFNPKVFLAKLGTGKTISKYRKDQTIYAQGDAADMIFYVQKGKIKSSLHRSKARKRSSRFWRPISSSAKGVSMANHDASRRPRRWRNA